MKFLGPLQRSLQSVPECFAIFRKHNLIQECRPIDGTILRLSPEDLEHLVVFPGAAIFGDMPYEDTEFCNFTRQLQPRLALAKTPSSDNNLSGIAIGIVNASDYAVLIDR